MTKGAERGGRHFWCRYGSMGLSEKTMVELIFRSRELQRQGAETRVFLRDVDPGSGG